MRKKILLFVISIFTFFITSNVSAAVISCDYEEYVLEFDTLYYDAGFGNDGYCDKEPLCVYNKEKKALAFRFHGSSESLKEIKDETDCPKKIYFSKDDVPFILSFETNSKNYDQYSFVSSNETNSKKVSCGNITDIPKKIPELTSLGITMVHVAIPVILVIMGSIDLFKGITAQKEDEIKKGQQLFVKRLILAALIFFVVVIVKLLISVVANSSTDNISNCIDCFISNDCD